MIKYKFSSQLIFALSMENPEIFKGMLERIFPDKKIKDLKLSESHKPVIEATQLSAIDGKQVRFDVLFEGEDEWIDVEMQRSDNPDLPLRCRFYSSIMDVKGLKAGENYGDLKKSYVIFICEFDFFRINEPIYTFARVEKDLGLLLGDDSYIIILNTKSTRDGIPTGLKNLFDYINEGKVAKDDAFIKSVDAVVESLQSSKEVYAAMTMYEEFEIERQRWQKEKIEIARTLKNEGTDIDLIVKATGLSKEEVEKL